MQFSIAVRNSRLDAIETAIGASAVLKIRTGTAPVDCAAADSGDVLATVALPADWMLAAAAGQKTKSGTWEEPSADMDGEAGHFRLYASDGTTCGAQGTVGVSRGDLQLDSLDFVEGEDFTITRFTLTEGNS
jgi:hypothetical protein